MTYDTYCKEIKLQCKIKDLTEAEAKMIMGLYLTRTSVEEAVKRMK